MGMMMGVRPTLKTTKGIVKKRTCHRETQMKTMNLRTKGKRWMMNMLVATREDWMMIRCDIMLY